jgi:hypothetical protein
MDVSTWIKQICLVILAVQRVCDGCIGPDLLELSKISWLAPFPSSHVFQQKKASKVLSFSLWQSL